MFTVKFYSSSGCRERIIEAQSVTVLRSPEGPQSEGTAEITMHGTVDGDIRYDIKDEGPPTSGYAGPERFARAIIENSTGKTTEIIYLRPLPAARS